MKRHSLDQYSVMTRREVFKWTIAAAAAVYALDEEAFGLDAMAVSGGTPGGYGSDPDLMNSEAPWGRVLTAGQLRTAAALADTILPADGESVSASSVGVHEFIDEWVSAPYAPQVADRKVVTEGLDWIEGEAKKRFGKRYDELDEAQTHAICDDLCYAAEAKKEFVQGARFFAKFRNLTAGAYFTTPEGFKDVGYVGNVALGAYPAPPVEALRKLGLA